jgi:trehalose 6-phosphate synthase
MTDVLVCSHRGPVSHRRTEAGVEQRAAAPGGLVPVMLPALERAGGTWLFAASTDGDRDLAAAGDGASFAGIPLRLVALPAEVHREHYEVVTNGYLARIFHYLFPLAHAPTFGAGFRRAWASYREVNERYAQAIRVQRPAGPILIEDMHLMLVAAALRGSPSAPDVPLLYFHHVPWCSPDYFGVLPDAVREEILRGLLAHDSVAFHSARWADAFGACCERFLAGAAYASGCVSFEGRSVPVLSAPAALDVETVRESARGAATAEWRERFEEQRGGRRLLVRVDRADLWKNVVRGFEAYGTLLDRRPELAGEVAFLAVLSPTRMWIPEYRDYLAACRQAADAVNERHASGGAAAVTVDVPDGTPTGDRGRSLGALAIADAVLVNPLFDGLNMVAKETPIAGEGDPVLVLSENAGAHPELAPAALSINPFDVEATAVALEQALAMPARERAESAARLRAIVEAREPSDWLATRLAGWL